MSAVIALTETERTFLEGLAKGVYSPEVEVIPNGLSVSTIRDAASKLRIHATKAGAPSVVFAGRLAENKGLEILLRAFDIARRRHPNLQLILVGPDFGMRARLERLADQLRVRDGVRFLGLVSAETYLSQISSASCLVLPSTYGEAQGVVLLEGLAAGVPVIGTRVGGVPDTLRHGTLGRLVLPGDVPELAESIETAVASTEDGSFRPHNLDSLAEYEWSHVSARVEATYRRALNRAAT